MRSTVVIRPILAASVALVALAGSAAALEPLAQQRYINDRLVAARVADRVRKTCPSIDGRLVSAFTQARALKRYAQKQGYSDAEIDAFLDSKPDRQRIYATAEAYLAQNGAKAGDAESFCRVGRAEIAAGSVAGSLLVAK